MTPAATDIRHMRAACRLALRGHGGAEPNPMVGCVVVNRVGAVVGRGFHARCGEAHAEVNALATAGDRAVGGTAYVSLEPCSHHGRTPPCVDALASAGVARVVFATKDPNGVAAGGAGLLGRAGIKVEQLEIPEASVLNEPFLHRVRTGLPWVCTKWAMTMDGRITTGEGGPRWITSDLSRREVHRERGCVDVMLTGIGTVIADDPDLRPRGVRAKRIPRRIVVDTRLELPMESALVSSVLKAPVEVVAFQDSIATKQSHALALQARGIRIEVAPQDAQGRLLLRPVLERLAREGVANVLVEAGGGINGELLNEGLINEVWAFHGGLVVGDGRGIGPVRGLTVDGQPLPRGRCVSAERIGPDLVSRWRVDSPSA